MATKAVQGAQGAAIMSVDGRVAAGTTASTAPAPQPPLPDDDRWVTTPVWRGENEFASRGETRSTTLVGIPKGATELAGVQLRVRGQSAFAAGKTPGDLAQAADDGTRHPESFVQAQTYDALTQVRDTFDSLGLPLKFAQLVGAKSGQTELLATVNALQSEEVKASYFPPTEEMFFGTLVRQNKTIWDLGADGNVVQHEAGHFVLDHLAPSINKKGDGGVLHEGYADAQAAFLSRDPEIVEDYGLVSGKSGEPLRSAQNRKKISEVRYEPDKPHGRGEVVAGYLWDIAEEMHRQLTGRARAQEVDSEPLDIVAAREALKVLWTFPLYLGTKEPKLTDVVTAADRAIAQLARAGKLDRRLDVVRLRAVAQRSADERELTKSRPADAAHPIAAQSPEAAAAQALAAARVPRNRYELARVQALPSVGGTITYRFELRRPVVLRTASGEQRTMVPVEDDFVTVIKTCDGYEVKLGVLPNHYAIAGLRGLVERVKGWFVSSTDAPPELASERRGADELRQHAASDVNRLLNPDPGWLERAKRVFGEGPEDVGGRSLLEQSRNALTRARADRRSAALEPRLVWRHGEVQLRLVAGPLTYYAPVHSNGRIGSPERIVNALYE